MSLDWLAKLVGGIGLVWQIVGQTVFVGLPAPVYMVEVVCIGNTLVGDECQRPDNNIVAVFDWDSVEKGPVTRATSRSIRPDGSTVNHFAKVWGGWKECEKRTPAPDYCKGAK